MVREKRRFERFPVFHEASVKRLAASIDPAAHNEFPARVVDLSRGGARLELRELVHPSEKLHVVVGSEKAGFGLDATSVVRWSEKITGGYQAGVQFVEIRKFTLKSSKKPAPEKPKER